MTAFSKTPKAVSELIALLEHRGLRIKDRALAERYLRTVGYYRLSGYTLLLEKRGVGLTLPGGMRRFVRTHEFQDGATFEQVVAHYEFDRRLRLHVFDGLGIIEVAVRAAICDYMALRYGNTHWYENPSLFNARFHESRDGKTQFGSLRNAVISETRKDDERKQSLICAHYYSTYKYPELPPAWTVAEQLSIAWWSKIFQGLRDDADRNSIATSLQAAPADLRSWLIALSYLRNLCAHHARLLSAQIVIQPTRRSSPGDINPKRFAANAAAIHFLVKNVTGHSTWLDDLKGLFARYPTVDKAFHLGFHKGWPSDSFWQ
jgi:abortive infection bacteriophage resistance protein